MFFKISNRKNPDTGKFESYYRLVESYRDINGTVRNRTVLTAGFIDHLTADELIYIQRRLTEKAMGKSLLFEDELEAKLGCYIEEYFDRMLKNKKIDDPKAAHEKVYVNSLEHKNVKEIGSEWLCLQALKQLGIEDFLRKLGWFDEEIQLSLTQIVSRAVFPASELKTSLWIKENSSICELTGYPVQKITKDKLYENALLLNSIKNELEQHLSKRTNELFDIQDKIYLYDLTNTYFEGDKRKSKIAKRGRSKEKRKDAKLIVLALVVNVEGFIKYSNIYEGNMADCATLSDMIDSLHQTNYQDLGIKPIVVIDAGISTEENLTMIKNKGFDYICVRRSKLKDYVVKSENEITVYDKKNQKITLCAVENTEQDYIIKVKSEMKEIKERSMNQTFRQRFEEGMEIIKQSLSKKNGTKIESKVNERIGRLKQKYPSVARFYDIELTVQNNKIVSDITWAINPCKIARKEDELGVYFIRTSLQNKDEKLIWNIYNSIREIEYTFRTLKTDLDLRPVYHKNDNSTIAHLHLGLLAYWLVNTIRYQLKCKGINSNWQEIVRIGNTQKIITTTGKNENGSVELRKASKPDPKIKLIYDALNYKFYPYKKAKFVVPKSEFQKNKKSDFQQITDE